MLNGFRMPKSEWTSEFEFRATGPERGGGNLQLWYTKDAHGTSSIYTVGKFDGLVLEVDAYGGKVCQCQFVPSAPER